MQHPLNFDTFLDHYVGEASFDDISCFKEMRSVPRIGYYYCLLITGDSLLSCRELYKNEEVMQLLNLARERILSSSSSDLSDLTFYFVCAFV